MTPLKTTIFDFSLGYKPSYDSDYDSDYDYVASENQPLDRNVFSTLFLYTQLYKWVLSLDKGRGTKVMQDRSSYEVCKNEM